MNKFLLLAAFVLFTFRASSQQPFAPAGAAWHFDWWSFYPCEEGFEVIAYESDTVILGMQCQKLSRTLYDFTFACMGQTNHDIIYQPVIFIYQNGDTVFWLSNSRFEILYNFGAQPGDEWVTERFDTGWVCDSISTIHVDTVGIDTINGEALRWLAVHTVWGSPTGTNGRIYERLGSLQHLLPPLFVYCDSSIIVDGGGYKFHCYEDATFSLYNAGTNDCEYLLMDVAENIFQSSISIVPNPGTDYVNMKNSSGKIKSVSVYDCLGRKVPGLNSIDGDAMRKYDIQNLETGIYFFEIITTTGKDILRFIKQ